MSLVSLFKGKGPSGFGYGSTASEVLEGLDLSGKTYLLTGCNSGIGKASLEALSRAGAHMIAAARTVEKATAATQGLSEITPVACELSEPESVRACVETVRESGRPLDGILCNAGIMALPKLEQVYGYEKQFFTNHIGHSILVLGLLDQLTDDGRVVMVSSSAHKMTPKGGIELDNLSGERNYKSWAAYGQSKLANLLFARQLAAEFESDDTDRVAIALHPGVIKTNLGRHMNPIARIGLGIVGPIALKTIPQGASTQTYALAHPDAAKLNGEYLADCNVSDASRRGQDMDLAQRLMEKTRAIIEAL